MKIAFVFPPMWSPHSDGSLQVWNHEVTTRLSKSCCVVVYSAPVESEPDEARNGLEYRRISIRIDNKLVRPLRAVHRSLGIPGPLLSSDFWYPVYALKVALDLRKQGCDVAHVYYYPHFAAIIRRFNPKLRVILHMHGEWLTQCRYTNLAARLGRIHAIAACSDYVAGSIRAMFPHVAERCRTIPMGVSTEAFAPVDRKVGAETARPTRLLCVGRVSPEKGVHDLLDAFELISHEHPDATLSIVGPEWIAPRDEIVNLCLNDATVRRLAPFYEGSYLTQLKRRLAPETAKRVSFVGLVGHNDVPAYYGDADVFVSPSLYESFGTSLIEAMAAGVPVVATRVAAVPEVVSHGSTGLLVEAGNPAAMADAVLSLCRNADLRASMCAAARDAVLKRYSWQSVCSALMELYRDVLHNSTA